MTTFALEKIYDTCKWLTELPGISLFFCLIPWSWTSQEVQNGHSGKHQRKGRSLPYDTNIDIEEPRGGKNLTCDR